MKLLNFEKQDDSIIINTSNGKIKVEPITLSIFNVRYTKQDKFKVSDVEIVNYKKSTHILVDIEETDSSLNIATDLISLTIDRDTCAFTFRDSSGNILMREPENDGKIVSAFGLNKTKFDENDSFQEVRTIDGMKVVADGKEVFDRIAYHTKLSFVFDESEAIYGLGSHEEGVMNLRGSSQQLYQQNMKAVVPMLVSSKGYGILMNNCGLMTFHDDQYGSYWWCDVAEQLDYYFIGGNDIDSVVAGYRLLTGAVPLLPKWAYGYLQSKERYKTAEEMLSVAKQFRKEQIPLDALILDWKSWEGELWGQKTFDETRFPDPEGLADELHAINVAWLISVWPNMRDGGDNNREMLENNCMLANKIVYDAFSEKGRELYWKQANEGLFSRGVDGWWTDCTEPFESDWGGDIKPEPEQRLIINTFEAKKFIDPAYINAYSLEHSKGIFEGQRKTSSSKRVINLTRSAYAGQQRYATITWSGDISANWETLRNQICAGLNFCITGSNYWTLDIGAFFVGGKANWGIWCDDPSVPAPWYLAGDYDKGCEDLGYQELYTRWLQLGVFLPMFRSHGTDTPREPWNFKGADGIFYDSIVKFIKLRYTFMPYIYSLAAQVTFNDDTMMRSLVFDFSNDPEVFNIKDQFMFGRSLLICPITQPMYYKANSIKIDNAEKSRKVYLPKRCGWYDFWTNKYYEGGQTITAYAPIETMPIYVKAGSVLAMQDDTQFASQETNLKIRVYVGADGECYLYEDSGNGYEYSEGHYWRVKISWAENERTITFHEKEGLMSCDKSCQVEIVQNDSALLIDKVFNLGERFNYCLK